MKITHLLSSVRTALFFGMVIISTNAHAAIDNANIMDDVLRRYSTAASAWGTVITAYASWLFWTLTLISMVWTFGMLALRKADIAEFFAEFFRFTVFTGFFWWLLTNGPRFATSIIDSLRQIGSSASGTGGTITPSGIVDIGFDIFAKVYDSSSGWTPVDSTIGIIISLIILVVLALVAVNMLLLLISGWILAYAGIFFLGFGGSRWTSDIAISYFKTVLSIAAQLFTMVLLVGIGKSFVDQYYTNMSAGIQMKELGVMLIVSVVLLALVNKVPPQIGQISMGGGTGAIGNGFGAGAAVGAAAMGTAAMGMAGAAAMNGMTSMGGGASAIKAAYEKAQANMGGDGGGAMPSFGGSGSTMNGGNGSGGVSALASAMGTDSNWAMPSFGGSGSTMNGGNDSGSTRSNSGASAGSDTKRNVPDGTPAAKAGKGSTSTIGNLAQGAMDVARANFSERVAETTGGKIAAAIRASGEGAEINTSSTFNDNSLSAGTNEPVDPESEVAAFRDRNSQAS
jgi:type IV secretion system protein TrbL